MPAAPTTPGRAARPRRSSDTTPAEPTTADESLDGALLHRRCLLARPPPAAAGARSPSRRRCRPSRRRTGVSAASIVRFWCVTTMNCARSEKRAQDLQETVDVEVVERGLDLVEDVERARPGEEDGEQERERGHRLLAAGEQRQALGRLARRVISISTPSLSSGRRSASSSSSARARRPRSLGAAEHGARAGVLAHEPQAAAAAGEQVADDLLEVAAAAVKVSSNAS